MVQLTAGTASGGTDCEVDEIVQTIDPVRRSLEKAVADHPVKALVVSLTVGVVLGWLIKH